MKYKEIIGRLTGITTPVFGVSWNPPETERVVARRLITHLEDRRVLYNPSEVEVPDHCVTSVLEIRRMLSSELAQLTSESTLAEDLRAMRAACRKFLDSVQTDEKKVRFGASPGHYASWYFIGALGELRGVFGIYLARIAVQYGLNMEDKLASILPITDENHE